MTELIRLAKAREDFALESTLSGKTYPRLLTGWKTAGYQITIVFLTLTSPQLASQRIDSRVRQGGHDIPRADVLRRFQRGWDNYHTLYRPLAHAESVYDNSCDAPHET